MAFVMSWPEHGKLALPTVEELDSNPSTDVGSDGSTSEWEETEGESDSASSSPFACEETMLLLDWDDTMLPTTWIEAQGLSLSEESTLDDAQRWQLTIMAKHALQTLQAAQNCGAVVLVTNAEAGWVELSCQKFMPLLYPFLQNVKILSARSTYEPQGIARPSEWKYWAFQNEIDKFYKAVSSDHRKNIISIGDSLYEREALIRVTEHLGNSCVKSLKLKTKPDLEQLLQQHQLVSSCLDDIVNHAGSLDVCIQ